ncbi:hypothetical protein POM88_035597 [Heracleum sosnowskyi]|uniref:Uncharacterized protein n=1 Tax=Heracleum sosnowskyi TaxID=360622 RepID=A0AAD8HNT2_9APIA|nr:hypothetical protein POM88_035597 [Heracleum sosnowskyi]
MTTLGGIKYSSASSQNSLELDCLAHFAVDEHNKKETLVLFKANMHRADYLNGGTALHLAALNGHSRCIQILLADYIPSVPNFCNILNKRSRTQESILEFDRRLDIPKLLCPRLVFYATIATWKITKECMECTAGVCKGGEGERTSSVYADITWRSVESEREEAGAFGYGLGSGAGDVQVKTSPGYVGGYSVSKGQTSRGIAS